MGRPALVNPLLAKFARRFDCPVHGIRVIRLPRHRFRLELTPPLDLPRDADGRSTSPGAMQAMTRMVEGWVREHPEQWLWMHRRWRPPLKAAVLIRSNQSEFPPVLLSCWSWHVLPVSRTKFAALAWIGLVGAAVAAPPVAVVELFTSQGCSSCPPADEILGELSKRQDVVALTFPVDYWDYLGWKDTLAHHVFTKRQKAYAKAAATARSTRRRRRQRRLALRRLGRLGTRGRRSHAARPFRSPSPRRKPPTPPRSRSIPGRTGARWPTSGWCRSCAPDGDDRPR